MHSPIASMQHLQHFTRHHPKLEGWNQ